MAFASQEFDSPGNSLIKTEWRDLNLSSQPILQRKFSIPSRVAKSSAFALRMGPDRGTLRKRCCWNHLNKHSSILSWDVDLIRLRSGVYEDVSNADAILTLSFSQLLRVVRGIFKSEATLFFNQFNGFSLLTQ